MGSLQKLFAPCLSPQPTLAGGQKEAQNKVCSLVPGFSNRLWQAEHTPLLQSSPASEKMLLSALLMPFGAMAEQGWLKTPFCWDVQHLCWQPLPTRLD